MIVGECYVNPMSKPSPNRKVRRLYIGEWIDALGLERRKIAKEAGITESYLSLLINNFTAEQPKNPSVWTIIQIADAASVSIDLLRQPPPHTIDGLRKLPPDLVDRLIKR